MPGSISGSPVGSIRKIIAVTPVVTAGIYSAGDAVGGKLTFSGAALGMGSGIVSAVTILDLAKQNAALELVLFDADFTAIVDNAVFDILDADLAKIIGSIKIAAADYSSYSDNSSATKISELPFDLTPPATTLYGQLFTTGTPTYAAVSDLTVKLIIQQD